MAKITPTRPKYWRKDNPVVYVVVDRMYVRARAESIYNPRTVLQQLNRNKMSVASRFLAQMQPMVAKGFQGTMTHRPGWQPRRVGAYHVALGHLLQAGMRKGADGWTIDYAKVQLSEGNSLAGRPVKARRDGREMSISFPKGLPKGTRRVRMALHSAKAGRTVHVSFDAPRQGETVRISLPKWAASGALHVYYTVDVKGKSRWGSGYLLLASGRSGRRSFGRGGGLGYGAVRAYEGRLDGQFKHLAGELTNHPLHLEVEEGGVELSYGGSEGTG